MEGLEDGGTTWDKAVIEIDQTQKTGATHSGYGAGGTPGSRELWRGGVVCCAGPHGGPGTPGRGHQKHTWKH